eukprot:TRINITY_DN7266_c0_g1_i1.p1 TRINITY_DN7266_c0_g1~~TRINITY_DN7266_c0_g1_i1.p1  ORF type:complete len:699 (+),score=119.38 TRINITY_DN7266_c0_g1_i1:231-2099(+)
MTFTLPFLFITNVGIIKGGFDDKNKGKIHVFTYCLLIFYVFGAPSNILYLFDTPFTFFAVLEMIYLLYLTIVLFFAKFIPKRLRSSLCCLLVVFYFINLKNESIYNLTTVSLIYETAMLLTTSTDSKPITKEITNVDTSSKSRHKLESSVVLSLGFFLIFIWKNLVLTLSSVRIWVNLFLYITIIVPHFLVNIQNFSNLKVKSVLIKPFYVSVFENVELILFFVSAIMYMMNHNDYKWLIMLILVSLNMSPLILPKNFQIPVMKFTSVVVLCISYGYCFVQQNDEETVSLFYVYIIIMLYATSRTILYRVYEIKREKKLVFIDNHEIFVYLQHFLSKLIPLFTHISLVAKFLNKAMITEEEKEGNVKPKEYAPKQLINFICFSILAMFCLAMSVMISSASVHHESFKFSLSNKDNPDISFDIPVKSEKIVSFNSFFDFNQVFNDQNVFKLVIQPIFLPFNSEFKFGQNMTLNNGLRTFDFTLNPIFVEEIGQILSYAIDETDSYFSINDFFEDNLNALFSIKASFALRSSFDGFRGIVIEICPLQTWKTTELVEIELNVEYLVYLVFVYLIFFSSFGELFDFSNDSDVKLIDMIEDMKEEEEKKKSPNANEIALSGEIVSNI